jgi:hypothetical protein
MVLVAGEVVGLLRLGKGTPIETIRAPHFIRHIPESKGHAIIES